MIKVHNLSKEYDNNFQVISGLDFALERGRSLTIIGPSGCGKTTLLYIIAGLVKPTSGSVTVNGHGVDGPSKEIAFILQDFGLLPWKTVRDNICLGMKIRGESPERMGEVSERLMRELGLEHHRDDFPSRLSGGEKQRVAIGRALAMEPQLLLMDEPFSSLDTITRERMQDNLLEIRRKNELTMIMVTHSIEEAAFLGDTVLVLSDRPCSIKEVIDNPHAGGRDHRGTEEFFSVCKRIRQAVGS